MTGARSHAVTDCFMPEIVSLSCGSACEVRRSAARAEVEKAKNAAAATANNRPSTYRWFIQSPRLVPMVMNIRSLDTVMWLFCCGDATIADRRAGLELGAGTYCIAATMPGRLDETSTYTTATSTSLPSRAMRPRRSPTRSQLNHRSIASVPIFEWRDFSHNKEFRSAPGGGAGAAEAAEAGVSRLARRDRGRRPGRRRRDRLPRAPRSFRIRARPPAAATAPSR